MRIAEAELDKVSDNVIKVSVKLYTVIFASDYWDTHYTNVPRPNLYPRASSKSVAAQTQPSDTDR